MRTSVVLIPRNTYSKVLIFTRCESQSQIWLWNVLIIQCRKEAIPSSKTHTLQCLQISGVMSRSPPFPCTREAVWGGSTVMEGRVLRHSPRTFNRRSLIKSLRAGQSTDPQFHKKQETRVIRRNPKVKFKSIFLRILFSCPLQPGFINTSWNRLLISGREQRVQNCNFWQAFEQWSRELLLKGK